MATTVCLVRHGQTDANIDHRLQGREDRPLNERGIAQARLNAEHLAQERWDVLATSPTWRAVQTARIIAERLGMPESEILPMREFEAREPGEAYYMTAREIEERWPDGDVPGAESRESVRERMKQGLLHLVERYPGKRIIIVSHREGINGLLWLVSNGEIGTGKTQLGNGSISTIQHQDGKWEILSHNVRPEE
ncbi:MAG: histidine phosphatase family protein [Chloroflexota bacterium]|nr:histidine phosphatase family protein [Chloroflexota bacterium]